MLDGARKYKRRGCLIPIEFEGWLKAAEIQIWRTGVFGVITNFPVGSSNSTFSTPPCCSTSKTGFRLCLAQNQMLHQRVESGFSPRGEIQFIQHAPSLTTPVDTDKV